MIETIYKLIASLGLDHTYTAYLTAGLVVTSAVFVGYLTFLILHFSIHNYIFTHLTNGKSKAAKVFVRVRLLRYVILLIPAFFVLWIDPLLLSDKIVDVTGELKPFLDRVTMGYILVICGIITTKALDFAEGIYNLYPLSKEWPIRSYMQFMKVFVFILFAILVVSALLDKSALGFITGLGAVMAIVILVFKDAILSFVASLQLSSSKMMKKGDWVEVPGKDISGTIIDMSLNTIKIQNFDKTISMVPPYYMTNNSVKNWQGMYESGGRRIKRALEINVETVHFVDKALLDKIAALPLMADYIKAHRRELEKSGTNIELFRLYIQNYIAHDDRFHHSGFISMVRQLSPTANGSLPLEVYTFTNSTVWVEHEAVQAELFSHIFSMLSAFDLRAYQYI